MPVPHALTLYVRQGCHLCEDAAALLQRLGYDATLLDVDASPDLVERYGEKVPVLVADGREVLSGAFRESTLRRSLGLTP